VQVGPDRIERWLRGFAERHAVVETITRDYGFEIRTDDGSVAHCHVPFPPVEADSGPGLRLDGLLRHVRQRRRVGVLLVRLGGFAVGVFDGTQLVESKVDSRQVHGRAAAGGWSQKRFARRREGQVRVAGEAAADVAFRLLVGKSLDAVVTGGERRAVGAVLADDRLTSVQPLVVERFLTVPDPKKTVLEATPDQFRAVDIRIVDP
jgi:hypothetical protein